VPTNRKLATACVLALAWNPGAGDASTNGGGSVHGTASGAGVPTEMIRALQAGAPHDSLREAAGVFGRLVGTWDLTCDRYFADGTHTKSSGVWYFGWIVDGRMMQDVIYFFPEGRPDQRVGGTTLRLYDSQAKQWRVTFFAPSRNAIVSLAGGIVGDRIILLGTDVDGATLRWSFNDIKPDSFHWLGEISTDGGKHWKVEQEMRLTRRLSHTAS
jgi:hypothetical protein